MNETVTIKEGGLTRRLAPVDKLKVNTTDNKESTWVSAGKANTGVLHASENGIYIASEDGYEAYSEVIVRVTKDSFDGDTSFDDWDYETPDMDLDNWDPETIDDFELDPDGFDDIFNNEDEWKDIDKPIDIKMDNPKIKDTKISGIDPVTGNEMEVGLDADGYLTESTLPSSIKIVVPPDKRQYVDGQPILFSGMVVKGYTADGELWTDASHPDGVIPHSELTFPVTTAINDEKSKEWKGDGINAIEITYNYIDLPDPHARDIYVSDYAIGNIDGDSVFLGSYDDGHGGATILLTRYNNILYASRISGDNTVAYLFANIDGGWYLKRSSSAGTSNIGWFTSISYGEIALNVPESEVDPSTVPIKNLHPVGQTVPVQYIRSDGEVLEDSFSIEVLPDPDDAHPQVDPNTVEWNHRKYKANEDLGVVDVKHGSVYMEGGAIYDVGAAVRLGMLEPVDNEIVP